jgi:hypothetical protein
MSYAAAAQRSQEWDIFTGRPIDTSPRPMVWHGTAPPDPFA